MSIFFHNFAQFIFEINKLMKKIFAAAILLTISLNSLAQSGTNSPYSQFGLGTLAPQSTGFNRGMNGLAYGFHEHNQINHQNPASYSSLDSLTFIFDAGVSLQMTNFEENSHRKNANNGNLEYVVAAFRAFKHVGVSFGLIPYSNVGYNYSNTENVNAFQNPSSPNATYSNTFSGKGGLRQVYLGFGWEPFKCVSFGANVSYFWGSLNRDIVNRYSDNYINTLSKTYSADIKSYKLDFGLQFTQRVSSKDEITLGASYTLGHKLGADATCDVISTNQQTLVSDTTHFSTNNVLSIPHTYGVGFLLNHNNRLKIGFDYQLQQWKNIEMPQFKVINNVANYSITSGLFNNRHKYTLGGEYCKGERYRGFFNRIHYRAGVSYATSYLKINGQDGPREISASIGFGIPIVNGYNNRSILNISGEWVNQNAKGLIKENMYRINIGLTFNERWFAKFKVE